MEAKAQARYVRVTPQKARRVVDLIRGKQAHEAVAVLEFAPQAVSETVRKVVQSAIANARVKAAGGVRAVRRAALVVQTAFVDEGPTLKRFRPRAQGRAYRINKRTSHITVVVAPRGTVPGRARAGARRGHDEQQGDGDRRRCQSDDEGEDPLVGQKVNPHGFRLGITTEHKSRWFAAGTKGGPALPRLRQGGRGDPQAHVEGHGARGHQPRRDRAHP